MRTVLLLSLIVAAPAAAQTARLDTTQIYRVPVDGAPALGPRGAKITIVEFGEYHCPYCAKAQATLTLLQQEYPNEIRVVFRHRIVHVATAIPPAEAAMSAAAQGKFWSLHDALFANLEATRTRDGLEGVARSVGLDMPRLRRELTARTHEAAVMNDDRLGQKLGVNGTPTFFINGRPLVGAVPIESFRQLIDAELARADGLLAKGVRREDLYDKLVDGGLDEIEPPAPPAPRKPIPLEIERTLDALEACRDGNEVMAKIAYARLTGARKKFVKDDCKAMGVELPK